MTGGGYGGGLGTAEGYLWGRGVDEYMTSSC